MLLSSNITQCFLASMLWKNNGNFISLQKKSSCGFITFSSMASAYMCNGAVRHNNPNVDIRPISPKQWSPCRCEMNMWLMNEKCMCLRRSCNCVPSPQSIMNCLLPILITCELALWRVVGKADQVDPVFFCKINDFLSQSFHF